MYPTTPEVRVVPGPTAERWEGAARPGHFSGVLTIVAKLFHLVEPDLAVFGQKDIQQFTLIRRMVQDLDWPIEITMVRTVGLALSSRNAYLSTADRERARVLSRALQAAHRAWRAGETGPSALDGVIRQVLAEEPTVAVEYIAVVDPDRLAPVEKADGRTIIATAARVGGTRLIDNIILGQGTGE
jgi:pantoate--beta-alanine ligase